MTFPARRIAMATLALLLALPLGAQAQAVREDGFVRLGGAEQWVTIGSHDRSNPVVLFLRGVLEKQPRPLARD